MRFEKENVGTVLSTPDERTGTIPNDLRFIKRLSFFLLREYFQTSSKAEQSKRPKD